VQHWWLSVRRIREIQVAEILFLYKQTDEFREKAFPFSVFY
jgi:hypothetical protein